MATVYSPLFSTTESKDRHGVVTKIKTSRDRAYGDYVIDRIRRSCKLVDVNKKAQAAFYRIDRADGSYDRVDLMKINRGQSTRVRVFCHDANGHVVKKYVYYLHGRQQAPKSPGGMIEVSVSDMVGRYLD